MESIAYQGIKGSYSEEAAIKHFGKDATLIAHNSFEDVFEAIMSGTTEYGVIPLENTTTGPVYQVYDLLGKYGCYIVGEIYLSVSHCLLAIEGATLESVRTVFSHEQAFWQCEKFLNDHKKWQLETRGNTAVSAHHVMKLADINFAAIASKRAMEAYGLTCLKDNVQDQNTNITRFVIVAKYPLPQSELNNKISITFTLSHTSGTLYKTLEIFEKAELNLCKIESRPIVGRPWEYRFYLDFDGSISEDRVESVLNKCAEISDSYRLLGYYANSSFCV